MRWLADRQGGLPSSDQVSKLLSQEDFALFTDVYHTLTSDNLNAQVEESYRAICSRSREQSGDASTAWSTRFSRCTC